MKNDIIVGTVIAIVALVFIVSVAAKLPKVRYAFIVPEGYLGLLHQHGKLIEQLGPGRHVRWGRNFTIDAQDTRQALVAVSCQEVLTADNVGVKFSLVVTHQVTDPVKAAHDTQDWHAELYNAAQLALRGVVSGIAAE